MITNHGIHQWNVIPGLPDTGGQNVFVNQFTDTLEKQGLKISIVNRGGYAHPITGEIRRGIHYKNESCRILYLEDDDNVFVNKEEMDGHLPQLAEFLYRHIEEEGIPIDLLISHYWDGAKLGIMLNRKLEKKLPHVWIPHSLGSIKKRNVSPERWQPLNIDQRIKNEMDIVKEVDAIADTSITIREALSVDYKTQSSVFLPPCVSVERFRPRKIDNNHEIWSFLSHVSGLSIPEIQRCKIITEISRTDTTKRKNVLIDAFARVHKDHPDTFLIVAIDNNEVALSRELTNQMKRLGIDTHTAAIGNEWDRMPFIYAVTDIYCTPSIMEGFGMSAQEAAATRVPVVSSSLVPFVSEYLLGADEEKVTYRTDAGKEQVLTVGAGAVTVEPDDVAGFEIALKTLIENDALRKRMGKTAYNITVPYFTWDAMVEIFLNAIAPETPIDNDEPPRDTKKMPIAV